MNGSCPQASATRTALSPCPVRIPPQTTVTHVTQVACALRHARYDGNKLRCGFRCITGHLSNTTETHSGSPDHIVEGVCRMDLIPSPYEQRPSMQSRAI